MAIFRFKDRAERRKSRTLHETAMRSAEEVWFYSESVKPEQVLYEAYEAYVQHIEQLEGRAYSREVFNQKFVERMMKAGFIA